MLDGDFAYLAEVKMSDDSSTESGKAVRTGSAPWDADDEAGNDSSDLNNTLRTFDTAQYTFEFTTYTRDDAPFATYKNGNLYFEFVLPGSSDEIRFEDSQMAWLAAKNATYTISEQEVDGVTSQVMQGVVCLTPNENNPQAIGNTDQTLNVILRALAMSNGETIVPRYTLWLEGNDIGVDYGNWGTAAQSPVTSRGTDCAQHGSAEVSTLNATPITVSAAPRYNLKLQNGSGASNQYVGTFDFSTGNEKALDKGAGTVRGRLSSLGMTLSINGKEGQGLKGVELPKDNSDVTFDITLDSKYSYNDTSGNKINVPIDNANGGDYSLLVWSFGDNNNKAVKADGREIRHSGVNPITYFSSLNDKNNTGIEYMSCYDGGSWSAVRDGNVLHVTVSGMRVNTSAVSNFPYTYGGRNQLSYDYYTPSNVSNYWEIDTACISAGAMWVVQPIYTDDGIYVANQYADGTFNVTFKDSALTMETAGGNTVNNDQQAVKSDDTVNAGLALVRPGTMNQIVLYVAPGTRIYNNALTPGAYENGQDWVMAGNPLTLETWVNQDNAEGIYRAVGNDNMVKFDDAFFEPTGTYRLSTYKDSNTRVLYAAKPDGTGWDHHGLEPGDAGYDTEMIMATPDDLVFYESLDELKASGAVCVAAMAECRTLMGESQYHTHVYLDGICKETAQAGQVYMISPYSRIWRVSDVARAQGIDASDLLDTLESLSEADATALLRTYVPSKLDSVRYDEYPQATYINGGADGTSNYSPNICGYLKPYYNENGYVSRTEGNYFGDSCLVVSHKTKIAISPAQQASGAAKEGYDMDTNQRVADFVVNSEIRRDETLGHDTETSLLDDVTITVDLPQQLAYTEGSMYIGGSYEQTGEGQQGNVPGGTLLSENGTVSYVDEQGNAHDVKLELSNTSNGGTHLAVTIHNVNVSGETVQQLPKLFFSTNIGTPGRDATDVQNNTALQVHSEISSKYDKRVRKAENDNVADTGIRISKLRASTLSKYADQAVVEAGEPMGFTMNLGNNSSNPEAIVAIDNLPYDGNSIVNGPVYLSEFGVINADGVDLSELRFYYTTSEDERGKVSRDYMDAGTDFAADTNWTELAVDPSTGEAELPENTLPVSVAVVGRLAGNQNLQLHATFALPNSTADDFLVNTISKAQLSSTARSRVVTRTLDGLTWIDSNRDGIQNDGTTQQSGVTVTLLRQNDNGGYDEVASVLTGQQWDRVGGAVTDYDEGAYRFNNLLGGTYQVVFTSSDDFDISPYTASPKDKGGNDETDSDATATYAGGLMQKAEIKNIVMPSTEELQYGSYVERHQDFGFYQTETTFTAHKNWDDEENKYGKRPESVTVQLYAGNQAVDGQVAVLNAANNWTYKFEHLAKFDLTTNQEIVYSVKEAGTVGGYTTNNGTPTNNEQTVTNTMNKAESGSASFQIKKVREGATDVVVPDAVFTLSNGQTATTDENGIATFDFTFGDEETMANLTLTETSAPAGYTKSDASWTVSFTRGETPTVTLDQNIFQIIWNWVIGVESGSSYENGVLTVSNPYAAQADFTLAGSKELTGRTMKDDEFSFTVKEDGETVTTGKSKADGAIAFGTIHYTVADAGTHIYTVTEDKAGTTEKGVAYSNQSFTVTVEVTDNGDGTLTVTPTYPEGGVKFENRYVAEGKVTLEAEKNLNGRDLKEGEFTFDLKGADGQVIGTAMNDANGKVTFAEINYGLDEVGAHTYTITEEQGQLGGVTYSTESYAVTVTVSDNGDGTLKVETQQPETGVIFNNTYKAVGSIELEASKALSGRDLAAGEFNFTVSENGKSIATGSNDADGKVAFSAINYTLDSVGTHTYTITEDKGALGGVTYSDQSFTVTVEVTDNGDGTLKAVATYPADGVTFENTYAATGKVALEGTKTLTGRDLKAGEFSFTLKEGDDTIETVKNAADGKISFSEITYGLDEVGTHTYTITEDKGQLGGVTYDEQSFDVTVEVTDNGDGTLKVETTYPENGVAFENGYDTAPATLTLEGSKELTGRDLNDGEFTFTVKEGDDVVATGQNDEDGKIVFTDITYKLADAGTHTLIVTEDAGGRGGVEYSTESYTVMVTVSDNGDGTLKVEAALPEGGVVFHNGYTAAEAVVTLGANKKYAGATLKDGQFSFELKDSEGKVVSTAQNKADGSIAFPALQFDEAGTYTYTISEVNGKAAGVTYDKAVYTVTITVTDDGEGKLVAEVDVDGKDLVFNNKYTPTVSKAGLPKTGDSSNASMWFNIMIASSIAVAALVLERKRELRR